MLKWTVAVLCAALPLAARADVKLHPLFCDHMVLQRDAKVTIWGSADPGEDVKVTLSVPGEGGATSVDVVSQQADAKGQWKASFNMPGARETVGLTFKGKNEIVLKNVAVGDVWLCSGQSNMEWKLNGLGREDQGKKVAATATNKNIRFFTVPNVPHKEPQSTMSVSKTEGLWLECTPATAINFSAVGYFFGREIEKSQKVPVGLIAADWGGTPAEAWTSQAGLEAEPNLKHYLEAVANIDEAKLMAAYEKQLAVYKVQAEKAKADGKPAPRAPNKPVNGGVNQNTPMALYNGMIAPIQNFKIKGAIWYQGESNSSRANEYRTLFPAMIKDWRKQWGMELPFFAVQLAPFKGGSSGVDYAELRDAQTYATKSLPKVGIAVITDSGEENDIHPQRKEPVGVRLALSARAIAYGEKIEYSGPQYKSHTVEGGKVVVLFEHRGSGLKCKGESLEGFAVCGDDKMWHPAKATIAGDTVVLTCDAVAKPLAVRFGWINFAKPELNFFNAEGLPAVPFRTDDFPATTK